MTDDLNATQKRVLDTLRAMLASDPIPPTVREIAAEIGRSPATVNSAINELIAKGLVTRPKGKWRSLQVAASAIQNYE